MNEQTKTARKPILVRWIAVLLCVCLIIGFAITAVTQSWFSTKLLTGTITDAPKIYTNLGDSIAAGTALPGAVDYDYSIPEDAYAKLFSTNYGAEKTNNFAFRGNNTTQLLEQLEKQEVQDAIQKSSVITIACGSNDLLGPAMLLMANAIGIETNVVREAEQGLVQKFTENANNVFTLLQYLCAIDAAFKTPEAEAMFGEKIEQFKTNFDNIVNTINELNPNAKLLMFNYYNPYEDAKLDVDFMNVHVNIGESTDGFIDQLNIYLDCHPDNGSKFHVVDIEWFTQELTNVVFDFDNKQIAIDPHPNVEGHKVMAQLALEKFYRLTKAAYVSVDEDTTANKGFDSITEAWNYANTITDSAVTVTLNADWTAQNGKFGTGAGFDANGGIIAETRSNPNCTLTLNLAGHTVDRASSNQTGPVFNFDAVGSFEIIGGGTIMGGYAVNGGGINVGPNVSYMSISDVTITGNKAQVGGGLYVNSLKESFYMDNVQIINNEASGQGGGAYIKRQANGATLQVAGETQIMDNTAASSKYSDLVVEHKSGSSTYFCLSELTGDAKIRVANDQGYEFTIVSMNNIDDPTMVSSQLEYYECSDSDFEMQYVYHDFSVYGLKLYHIEAVKKK